MQLALFDFDHTIARCNTYARFLRAVATPPQLAQARWTAGPWLPGYRAGVVSAARMRARCASVRHPRGQILDRPVTAAAPEHQP